MGHGLGCVARSAAVWEFVVPEGDVCLWPRSLYRSIWKGFVVPEGDVCLWPRSLYRSIWKGFVVPEGDVCL